MRVNEIGLNSIHNSDFFIHRPYGYNQYVFIFIKSPACFIINNSFLNVEKNSVVILKKGTPHHYYSSENTYCNDWIHFDVDEDSDFFNGINLPLDTIIKMPKTYSIANILETLHLEFISKNQNKSRSMDVLIKYLFLKISDISDISINSHTNYVHFEKLLKIRSEIYRYPNKQWNVAELARSSNFSQSYFQRIYKDTFGIACIADVIASKIKMAKTNLTTTSLTIKEISILCGYKNEAHFLRQFKKNVGLTPSDYRKINIQ